MTPQDQENMRRQQETAEDFRAVPFRWHEQRIADAMTAQLAGAVPDPAAPRPPQGQGSAEHLASVGVPGQQPLSTPAEFQRLQWNEGAFKNQIQHLEQQLAHAEKAAVDYECAAKLAKGLLENREAEIKEARDILTGTKKVDVGYGSRSEMVRVSVAIIAAWEFDKRQWAKHNVTHQETKEEAERIKAVLTRRDAQLCKLNQDYNRVWEEHSQLKKLVDELEKGKYFAFYYEVLAAAHTLPPLAEKQTLPEQLRDVCAYYRKEYDEARAMEKELKDKGPFCRGIKYGIDPSIPPLEYPTTPPQDAFGRPVTITGRKLGLLRQLDHEFELWFARADFGKLAVCYLSMLLLVMAFCGGLVGFIRIFTK